MAFIMLNVLPSMLLDVLAYDSKSCQTLIFNEFQNKSGFGFLFHKPDKLA